MRNKKSEMNKTVFFSKTKEAKISISSEDLHRMEKDIVTFHLDSRQDIVTRIAVATLSSSDLHCRFIKALCHNEILVSICQTLGEQLQTNNIQFINPQFILNNINLKKLSNTSLMDDINKILQFMTIPFNDTLKELKELKNLNNKNHKKTSQKLKKISSYEDVKRLADFYHEEKDDSDAGYICDLLLFDIETGYDEWEKTLLKNYKHINNENAKRYTVYLPCKISNDYTASDISKKIKIYISSPLWQREEFIFQGDLKTYRNVKKFIDINSERLYIKTTENSMQTLTDCVQTGAGTPDTQYSDQVFPAWIDIRSYNIETTDKSETKDYYVVNVSEDLFKAFTEDYCCRLEICKERQNEQFWYEKEEEVSNSNGIKVHYYIFYIKKNERQNKQLIINYFVSLIVKKGLTNTTLKIADPPEGKNPPDFLPIDTSRIPDFLSKLRKGNDSSANS